MDNSKEPVGFKELELKNKIILILGFIIWVVILMVTSVALGLIFGYDLLQPGEELELILIWAAINSFTAFGAWLTYQFFRYLDKSRKQVN